MASKLFGIYPKPIRFPLGKRISRKEYLTEDEVKLFLKEKVVVEEKMDGKPVLLVGERYDLFCEDLKQRHSIHYHILARYAVFDVLDKEINSLVGPERKVEIYYEIKEMSYYQTTPFLLYQEDIQVYPDSLFQF